MDSIYFQEYLGIERKVIRMRREEIRNGQPTWVYRKFIRGFGYEKHPFYFSKYGSFPTWDPPPTDITFFQCHKQHDQLIFKSEYANNCDSLYALNVYDSKLEKGIKLSPNPAKDQVQILGMQKGQPLKVQVLDVHGRVVSSGENRALLNLQGFEPGVYFVVVRTKQELQVERLVLE